MGVLGLGPIGAGGISRQCGPPQDFNTNTRQPESTKYRLTPHGPTMRRLHLGQRPRGAQGGTYIKSTLPSLLYSSDAAAEIKLPSYRAFKVHSWIYPERVGWTGLSSLRTKVSLSSLAPAEQWKKRTISSKSPLRSGLVVPQGGSVHASRALAPRPGATFKGPTSGSTVTGMWACYIREGMTCA